MSFCEDYCSFLQITYCCTLFSSSVWNCKCIYDWAVIVCIYKLIRHREKYMPLSVWCRCLVICNIIRTDCDMTSRTISDWRAVYSCSSSSVYWYNLTSVWLCYHEYASCFSKARPNTFECSICSYNSWWWYVYSFTIKKLSVLSEIFVISYSSSPVVD